MSSPSTNSIDTKLLTALIRCYHRSIRNKPRSKSSLFHRDYERQLVRLCREITDRKYRPWAVKFFVVTKPKPREIVASHLRDRVVHHLVYERLSPRWEKRFSDHSYACRVGKGPLMATKSLQWFLRANRQKSLYYLKADISNFFQSIDLSILRSQLQSESMDEETSFLVEQILGFKHKDHCTVNPGPWHLLPPHKSLFNAPQGVGLPIGNLTSQFFANVYLNEIDHWIDELKKGAKLLYWQRYVDDFLMISSSKEDLIHLAKSLDDTLGAKVRLSLNPKKTLIQKVSQGIDQLGYFHASNHLRIRDKVKSTLKYKVGLTVLGPRELECVNSVNSYLGLFKHADTFRLRQKIVKTLIAGNARLSTKADFSVVL